ncbi:gamma-glutamylcyclotransferase [Nasonia vitripennis]|uniref:gamma-glutamylcyclotransferase n=1 Tax=Nasonia vitripennis TaxID=7425 RepID=A0A7M7J0Q7_NASVI|nr:gamma-glutamylcyclotransferase [Nasonia vitripennis]
MSETFLYFAYGSNMLAKRIHYKNPTAVQKYIGKLKDHRLDFNLFTKRWEGCVATIVPTPGCEVWGVVWEIDISSSAALDEQEGVHDNIYFSKTVDIETSTGETISCKVYQQCQVPENYIEPSQLPPERQPSFVYHNIILTGAQDHGIPEEYIKYIKSFPHNGYAGETQVDLSLTEK